MHAMFHSYLWIFPKLRISRDIFSHWNSDIFWIQALHVQNVKQHLLSKSGFFFQITVQIYLEHFFIFVSKVNTQHFYLQDNILIITITIIIAYRPRKHDTHASMPSTQRCYPCHPRKHATHPITSHTLAQIARHFSNSISNNFEEQISFEHCRQKVHEYL